MQLTDVRKMVKGSLFAFAKFVVGYKDFSPKLHKGMCDFVQSDSKRKLMLIPRAHFKSSTATIANAAWRAVNNPNIRILVVSNTSTNAERFLREIGNVFTNNATFAELFPELVPDLNKKTTKWTSTEMQIPRSGTFGEPTFTAAGVGGAVTSRHYDLIIIDDPIDERINFEGDLMDKILAWYKFTEGLLVDPSMSEIIVIGTRYHFGDLYQHIIDNESEVYNIYHRKAIEDGQPIFPERFTLETLNAIRAKQGPVIFANQYMNDPIDTSSVKFREEQIVIVPDNELPRDLIKFMLTDTIGDRKAGKKKEGDNFALTCWGVDPHFDAIGLNDIYLLDAAYGQLDIEAAVNASVGMYARHRPSAFGIEKVGQSTFGIHIQNAVRVKGGYLSYEDIGPKNRQKEARIWSLLPYALNGKVHVAESMVGTPAYERFIYEWIRFPKVSHEDMLDSSAYIIDMIDKYRGSFDYNDLEVDEYHPNAYRGISAAGY